MAGFATSSKPAWPLNSGSLAQESGYTLPMKKYLLMLIVLGTSLLAGCGQTGPLYLPDQPNVTSEGR